MSNSMKLVCCMLVEIVCLAVLLNIQLGVPGMFHNLEAVLIIFWSFSYVWIGDGCACFFDTCD